MYLLLKGKQIHYDVLGSGSPILIVHGWGGSMESLRPLAKLLANSHKAILVDLPGFGASENPDPEWGVNEYADILVRLLKGLNVKKVDYFGHSFGGSLGIYLAARTNSVSKLILCATSYKRGAKKSKFAMMLKQFLPQNKPLRMLFYRIFFRNSDLAKYPHLEANFKNVVSQDLSDLPLSIHTPTLIIWGENDTTTPLTWAHELHEKIQDSTLSIIPHAKHGLPLRNPEIVAKEILSFI